VTKRSWTRISTPFLSKRSSYSRNILGPYNRNAKCILRCQIRYISLRCNKIHSLVFTQQGPVILTKFHNFDVWHKILEGLWKSKTSLYKIVLWKYICFFHFLHLSSQNKTFISLNMASKHSSFHRCWFQKWKFDLSNMCTKKKFLTKTTYFANWKFA
jgi:hypothetical protein